MNKKNAFIVAAQFYKNMVLEMENNVITVLLVVDIFLEEKLYILHKYGMNIQQENKPINSLPKSTNAVQKLFKEK